MDVDVHLVKIEIGTNVGGSVVIITKFIWNSYDRLGVGSLEMGDIFLGGWYGCGGEYF